MIIFKSISWEGLKASIDLVSLQTSLNLSYPSFSPDLSPCPPEHPEQTTEISCAVSHGTEHNREYEAMDQEMFHVRQGKEGSRAKVNGR